MRPSISEQLDGIRRVLATVVAPQVDDAYARDVLAGAITTLETLTGWHAVPSFLRWDAERCNTLAATVGAPTVGFVGDPLDMHTLAAHQAAARAALEAALPAILADPSARAATVAYFRERCATYPLTTNRAAPSTPTEPTGSSDADTTR
ncbi:MAG: hypothetical protein JWM34_2401 [Ilumatobacteraceae bacterium]|nr:hypothetical protein [Ilumatobacteraceae bacterium]